MKKIKNFKHIFSITIICLIVLFTALGFIPDEFNIQTNWYYIYRTGNDTWQDTIYKHSLKSSKDIVIIKIDRKTINTLQGEKKSDLKMLTIPKSKYSEIIEKLEFAEVKGIGIDIIFQNTDEAEGEFANIMGKNKNIVIASYDAKNIHCVHDTYGTGKTCDGVPRSIYRDIPWGIISTNKGYSSKLFFDISNTPFKEWKGSTNKLYNLSVTLALLGEKSNTNINSLINSGKIEILDPYFGGLLSYNHYSFIDILNMQRSEAIDVFRGKYVFIGESGTDIHDEFISPVTGEKMDGVELHAHFLDGLLQNKMLTKAPDWSIWLSCIFLTILTVNLYFFLPRLLGLGFALFVICFTLWFSRYLYDVYRILVDIFPISMSVVLSTFVVTYTYKFFVVDSEKRFIEGAFSHYIDPKMVEMINMEEVAVTLGGEQRELSVFFSDIAGFTTISERLSPKDLFWLMSLYLSRMTDILKKEGGTLDKYIGDAVMGFFGAPVAQTDHAVRACRTAVEMMRVLPEINAEITAKGIQALSFRVGIASGDVMVGNIGSIDHFNYTVLGDVVNLASRLEATGKEYNNHVIISEGTRAQIGDLFELRELDTIAVKGKSEGIKIYELLGYQGTIGDRSMYDTYAEGLALYRSGQYMEAGKLWESIVDTDPVSRVMMLRCVEILSGNITVENGVYHMTHK